MVEINNNDFGGFVVSNNILDGKAIRYSYREKSAIPQLNGLDFCQYPRHILGGKIEG